MEEEHVLLDHPRVAGEHALGAGGQRAHRLHVRVASRHVVPEGVEVLRGVLAHGAAQGSRAVGPLRRGGSGCQTLQSEGQHFLTDVGRKSRQNYPFLQLAAVSEVEPLRLTEGLIVF